MPTINIIIKGKVQGVFYRATARDVADALVLKGWIKNTDDGDVEAVVSGGREQLNNFITWCWKGPESAKVAEVIVSDIEDMSFNQFEILK